MRGLWQQHVCIAAGDSPGADITHAVKSTKAYICSGAAVSLFVKVNDPTGAGYVPFTTNSMITIWVACDAVRNVVEQLVDWGLDGVTTDYRTLRQIKVQESGAQGFCRACAQMSVVENACDVIG